MQVADGLEIRVVKIADLREQDINAQVMQPQDFERLTENVRERGALESLPYCYQPDAKSPIELVSGHHRARAARAAGLEEIPVLIETRKMSLSEIRSKQLAHNYLVGNQDEEVVRQMVKQIAGVDDLLRSGAPETLLPLPDSTDASSLLGTPTAEFDWRTVSFTFLPRQLGDFRDLIDRLEGRQDLVGVAPLELFEVFAKAVAGFGRIREVRSVGTTIALLTRIAADRIEMQEETPSEESWVKLESVFDGDVVPAPVGAVVREALARSNGEAPWQLLEQWATDYLEGSDA